jgi:hypothetical protein
MGGCPTDPSIKIDPQTIFVSQPGMCELIFKSKMSAAVKFYEWIIEEVIPELMEHGTYTIPIKKSDIEKLNKSFYDDNMLSEYMGSPCIYFSYVGIHKIVINGITREEHMIKLAKREKWMSEIWINIENSTKHLMSWEFGKH